MFTLSQSKTYTWPVTIRTAGNGKFETHSFEAEFRRLPMSEAETLSRHIAAQEVRMESVVSTVLCGWKGVKDDGAEVEFSDAALARLLEVPFMAACVLRAWQESLTGALEKN